MNVHLKFYIDTDIVRVITYLLYNFKLGVCSCFAAKPMKQSKIKGITLFQINLDFNKGKYEKQ